mgnify:CR=1 FL=1|jgi:tripartite ATP-independent transporter DctP family solute receptor|tara:strand:+ start:75 stop:1088 length:1014 start_codon:yes stop_codon:yes gene_type:complete
MKSTYGHKLMSPLLGAVLAAGLSFGAQADSYRMGSQFPSAHSSSVALKGLVSDVNAATEGRVSIDLFTDSQLGGAFEVIDQVRSGQVDFDISGPEWYGGLVPALQVLDLPFLINSYDQAYCMIDGSLGQALSAKVGEKNLVVLGWMVNGFRNVTNNVRPISSVDDINGLKIRTPPSKTYLETFRALGANPQPVDIAELYQALQQGVVDGQENPYDNIELRRFNEVQKYLSNTGHFFAWVWIVANKDSYEKISDADRTVLTEIINKRVEEQRMAAAKLADTSRNNLVSEGMTYTEISQEGLLAFRDKTAPVYELIKQQVPAEVYAAALQAASDCQSGK